MQPVDDRVMPGVSVVCFNHVDLCLGNLVVVVQCLPWLLGDHEELDVTLHDLHLALLLFLLVVDDAPNH